MKLFSKIAIYVGIGLFSLTPISCSLIPQHYYKIFFLST